MEKRKTIKDTLKEIEYMRKATKRRQKGENVTSEDIKARMEKREMEKAKEDLKAAKRGGNKFGKVAMGAKGTARNFAGDGEGQGYMPATKIPSKDYSKKSTTNSTDQYKAKKKSEDKAPRRSPAAGREDMMSRQRRQEIMDREERKRKNDKDKGGSNVVGS
jgi:hypothetical protein